LSFLGTDVEVWVTKDGVAIPAHKAGIPPKHEARKNKTFGTSYFRDVTGLEINTPPVKTPAEMVHLLHNGYKAVRADLGPAFGLSTDAAVRINPVEDLKGAPPDCIELGCNASWDAYKLIPKRPEMNPMELPIRTAGGHMHFSTDKVESENSDEAILLNSDNYPDIIKVLDGFIGAWAAFIYDDPLQWERRKVYGQAGEFRPQQYGPSKEKFRKDDRGECVGVEYRTPPPAIFNCPDTVEVFYKIGQWAMKNMKSLIAKHQNEMETWVQEAINEGKNTKEVARRFTVDGLINVDIATALKRHNEFVLGI